MGLLFGGALEAVLHIEKHPLCQEQPSVHHARSAAAHAQPATPGAGVDKQRQPKAWAVRPRRVQARHRRRRGRAARRCRHLAQGEPLGDGRVF
eukprot:scaffold22319_cov71-Phaeocystis_antarctica.AAC.2